MTLSFQAVQDAAFQLSEPERAELAEQLLGTVLPHPPLHPEWEAEIARRIDAMEAGLTESFSSEEVMAQLRALIEAHDPRP